MSKRPQWILQRSSFTSCAALAREIEAWLEFSDAKIIIMLRTLADADELSVEMDGVKTLGRIRVAYDTPQEAIEEKLDSEEGPETA